MVSEDLFGGLRLEHRTLTSCAAALAAVALHVFLVVPALWAVGASQHPQEPSYRGEATMQWVALIGSPGGSAITRLPSSYPALKVIRLTDALPMPAASALPVEVSGSGSAQSDGQSGFGALYGRYLGQIHARIDRAWQRPRTAIGAPIFQCPVQVDQDSVGRVDEITLLGCDGDARWQLSLVRAIEAASPLPVPPNPAFFAHRVLLEFRATAYSSGAPAQLYESSNATPASEGPYERDTRSRNAFRALREAAQARKAQVIELRIEGSKVEVEPDRQ